jgi:hypothetical protein
MFRSSRAMVATNNYYTHAQWRAIACVELHTIAALCLSLQMFRPDRIDECG